MSARVITMLSGTKTRELTLTVAGANGRRFAVAKSSGAKEMNFAEIAAQVLAEPAEGEDKLIESLKKSGATEEQIEASVGHYRMQQGFKDQVSPEMFGEIAKAAAYVTETPNPKPVMKKEPKPAPTPDIPEAVQKSLDAKDTEIAALRKSVADEKKARERGELIAEVEKSFPHVPGKSAEELADMLLAARAAGGDLEKSLRAQWSEVNKSIEASELLRTSGSALAKNITGGAIDTMNAKTKELVAKSAGELSFDQAFVQVMDAEPALYEQYLQENPAQRQR